MKSYTDLEQSKKLAKILPLESADMSLCNKVQPLMTNYISAKKKFSNAGEIPIDPCWSLVALLNILHNYTLQTNSNGCVFVVYDNKKPMISDSYDNPVDACVQMIIELNKMNLL